MPRLRIRRRRERAASSSLVLLGVGAAIGVALGAALADRVRGARRARGAQDPWLHVAHGAYDEEEELAPVPPRSSRRRGREAASVPQASDRAPSVERRVLEAFRNDPVLAERAIDIGEDAPGVIALTGWVRDDEEIRHARTIAGGVPGVARVEAALAVRPPRRPWTLRGSAPDASRG